MLSKTLKIEKYEVKYKTNTHNIFMQNPLQIHYFAASSSTERR